MSKKQRKALRELVRLSEEAGLYDADLDDLAEQLRRYRAQRDDYDQRFRSVDTIDKPRILYN